MNPENKTAILLHGYGNLTSPRGIIKPDTRGRLQLLAARRLAAFNNTEIGLTGGKIFPDFPPLALVMQDHLGRTAKTIPQDTVIANPVARNTNQEAKAFAKMARERGWKDITVIGSKTHLQRIKRANKRAFGKGSNLTFHAAEDVLQAPSTSKRAVDVMLNRIINKLERSKEEKTFKKHETVLNLIDSIPLFGNYIINFLTHALGKHKGNFQKNISHH